jgi:aminopeptidase
MNSINFTNLRSLFYTQKQTQTETQKNQSPQTTENSSTLTNYLSFTGNVNKMNIGFQGSESLKKADAKIVNHVQSILKDEIQLKEDQPLVIHADRKYSRFVELMEQEAYKMDSGNVFIEYKEPELEKLHKHYFPEHEFDWEKEKEKEFKKLGAASYTFDDAKQPFKASKLTQPQIKAIKKASEINIPKHIAKELEINPAEIIDTCLNLRQGQPVIIYAQREHEPNVLKIARYAYEHGSGPVQVSYTEPNTSINLLKYGKEKSLSTLMDFERARLQEIFDTNAARVGLSSPNPDRLKGLDRERKEKLSGSTDCLAELSNDITLFNPRAIYYAPTIAASKKAYPEYTNPLKALEVAAKDAKEINRTGNFKEHLAKLSAVAKKLNEFKVDKLHLTSSDGKTDLWVGLSKKSIFVCTEKFTPKGQQFAANCPSEEVFTTPDKNRTDGKVAATRPFLINGTTINDAQFEFKDGKIARDEKGQLKVYVTNKEEEKILRGFIESKLKKDGSGGSDMLGEISLVEDSPIAKKKMILDGVEMDRIFYNGLVDENAACHMAIGNGYPVCIDGSLTAETPEKRKELLAENNCNFSPIHTDIMIGSPNVKVEAVTKDGKTITVLENNKFQI